MIYRIDGWPLDSSWHIDRQRHLVEANIPQGFGVVTPIHDIGYCVYLSDSDLKLRDDKIIELLRQGRDLIHKEFLKDGRVQASYDQILLRI